MNGIKTFILSLSCFCLLCSIGINPASNSDQQYSSISLSAQNNIPQCDSVRIVIEVGEWARQITVWWEEHHAEIHDITPGMATIHIVTFNVPYEEQYEVIIRNINLQPGPNAIEIPSMIQISPFSWIEDNGLGFRMPYPNDWNVIEPLPSPLHIREDPVQSLPRIYVEIEMQLASIDDPKIFLRNRIGTSVTILDEPHFVPFIAGTDAYLCVYDGNDGGDPARTWKILAIHKEKRFIINLLSPIGNADLYFNDIFDPLMRRIEFY